jgi:preprotein translocase subunit SecE
VVFKQRAQQTDAEEPKESKRRIEKRDRGTDTAPRKSVRSENPVIRYFQETAVELRKVTWPTREQTLRLTLIVLGAIVVFSIFFGGFDLMFQRLAALLLSLKA